jgi:hypothetical protein
VKSWVEPRFPIAFESQVTWKEAKRVETTATGMATAG